MLWKGQINKTTYMSSFLCIHKDLRELFEKAKTKEEQDFYVYLFDLALQKAQEKVIGKKIMTTYTIFAGVNGVGKTSIYKSIYKVFM
ncbi:hypothetical protein CPAST_c30660 [Clostridium pasteurianum DSM 525 = ATCC 6013]|uniref:Uncharacterized protein n=1 Tax=Clostridium pasteurianum DSM 525 = ATCC 6013 TaxID=1262449 RepID=A0A0H3J7G8_CLOPA|nr:hypothetical protein CPAST_c30660 [Clostridium pasteurianum DSM 525 = ATCC 6013]AJA53120.1 hypothetical protein CLPA_c30660 [Clostridium pasteurianum DSM 525 = ATCC 6013]ELP59067.1 hypothetical protein F502_11286 [Clostridium pasteurianum DSM 525 = ATCC 6013]KRU10872.1 hypothetical protein CP6013_00119 [Clostridium pasteurianum DSM 525 = ATCC 6013]